MTLPKPPPRPPGTKDAAKGAAPRMPVPAPRGSRPPSAPPRPSMSVGPAGPAGPQRVMPAPPGRGLRVAPTSPASRSLPESGGLPSNVAAVLESMRLFDDVLGAENALLLNHDAAGVSALQERKLAATRLYHERLRALFQNPDALHALTPEQRARVRAVAEAVERNASHNAVLLKAGIVAIEKLFEAINNAVQQRKVRDVSYSQAGVVNNGLGPNAASLAFDRRV